MVSLSSSEQEFSFFFCLFQTKKNKRIEPCVKKERGPGGQKEKKKKEYVSLNGNTRKANGGIEISCST